MGNETGLGFNGAECAFACAPKPSFAAKLEGKTLYSVSPAHL